MAFVRVRNKETGQQKVLSQGMATALRNKYEIITEGAETENGEVSPNQNPTNPAGADDGVELANARAKYEELYGEKPHGRLKLETLLKLIAEKTPATNEA